jgi:heme-degrading monooxygenase HmoA
MAVELRAEIRGMTRAQYDQAFAEVQAELRRAPGFVAHAAGPMEGGYRVVEIWNSREDQERFLQQTIMPMAQRVGLPPFQPQVLPLDNVLIR